MRAKLLTTAATAAGLAALLGAGQAYAIPAVGDFTFTPGSGGSATVNTGNITTATTSKTLVSPGSTSASNLPGDNLGIVAGSVAPFSPLTLSIVTGALTPNFVLTVPSTTGGAGNTLTFTLTSTTLNSLVATGITATNTTGTGSIVDTLTGTLTGVSGTGLTAGAPVVDTQSCSQSVIGGVPDGIACSDTLIVGVAATGAPEPASLALLGSALAGFGVVGLRRRRKHQNR